MQLFIFDSDFTRIGILSNYISLTWQEFYQEAGKLTIVASDTPQNIALLRQGHIVYQQGKETAMIIRYVKYNSVTREITAHGVSTIDYILQRVIYPAIDIVNAEEGLYRIVTENLRGMPNIAVAQARGFTEEFETRALGEMFKDMNKIAVQTNLGLKMVFDYRNKRHVFTVYKGVTRVAGQREPAPVIFSEDFMNLHNAAIIDDMSVFANVAYIFGAASGDDRPRKLVILGDAEGIDRFELYIDARDLQPNQNESIDAERYVNVLKNRGIERLNKHIRVKTFQAEVEPSNFRVKYNLGDEITCKSEKYGVQINTRVMAYKEVTEKNMTTLSLTLGNPEIDALKEMKIYGE